MATSFINSVNATHGVKNKNEEQKISFIRYMIKKKHYQQAISIIDKELKKYPEYSNATKDLHELRMLAMYKKSTEHKNAPEQSNQIIEYIQEYKENFHKNRSEEKKVEKIENNLYANCSKHFLKIAQGYFTSGNYISAINHAKSSIKIAEKSANTQKIILKARKIIKTSLIKIGLLGEAGRVKI